MEYVCTGATLKCTMGTSCPKLKATPKNVSLTGKDQANIADYVSIKNIPSFGRCRSLGYPPTASATAANHGKLTPMPCVPGTCPKWKAIDKDSLICGEPALLKPATLKCMYGGTISIVDPGQALEIKGGITLSTIVENSESTNSQVQSQNPSIKKAIVKDNEKISGNYNNQKGIKGEITGGAAPVFLSPYDKKNHYNENLKQKFIFYRFNRIINHSEDSFYDTNKYDTHYDFGVSEHAARSYFSIGYGGIGGLKNAIKTCLSITSYVVVLADKTYHQRIFGTASQKSSIRLNTQGLVGENSYKIQYNIDNSDFYEGQVYDNKTIGVLIRPIPKGAKPTKKMFEDDKNVLVYNLNDENIAGDFYLQIEQDKQYIIIVFLKLTGTAYNDQFLFSNSIILP